MRLAPFFSYYGSKWRMAPHYDAPAYDTVIEPFAGSAGYSVMHFRKKVILYDLNESVCAIWQFLISATPEMILKMPLLEPGKSVDELQCSQEERLLIGFWLGTGNHSPRSSRSPRGIERHEERSPSTWGELCRRRIASQVELIKHWKIECGSYEHIDTDRDATWFVDPPYELAGRHYPHGSEKIDFEHLGAWCRELRGQVIVCENAGATWLDFNDFLQISGTNNRTSQEVIWRNKRFQPVTGCLFEEAPQ